jgi:hypothetical protein
MKQLFVILGIVGVVVTPRAISFSREPKDARVSG